MSAKKKATLPKVNTAKTNEQTVSLVEFVKHYEHNQDNNIVLPLQRRTRIIPRLISSVIEGRPLGKIYILRHNKREYILDGNNRAETISQFLNGTEVDGISFKAYSQADRERIKGRQIMVTILDSKDFGMSLDNIIQFFKDINLQTTKLTKGALRRIENYNTPLYKWMGRGRNSESAILAASLIKAKVLNKKGFNSMKDEVLLSSVAVRYHAKEYLTTRQIKGAVKAAKPINTAKLIGRIDSLLSHISEEVKRGSTGSFCTEATAVILAAALKMSDNEFIRRKKTLVNLLNARLSCDNPQLAKIYDLPVTAGEAFDDYLSEVFYKKLA